jgi:TetR/AcrR family transcriptional repressor of nem operon
MARTSDARERLLKAALELIWSNSYGGVGVDQICERAGVRKGSFYHFFPSKSGLAAAACEAHWEADRPKYDAIFSAQVPPLERLENWCQAVYESQVAIKKKHGHVCGCPYASLGSELSTQDESIRSKSQELMQRSLQYLESALSDAQRQGLISYGNTGQTARCLGGCALGLMLQAKIEDDPEILRDLKPAMFRLLNLPDPAAAGVETNSR